MILGFDYPVLSLMASEHAVEEKLGHKYRKVEELEDDTSVPRVEYIAPESIGEAEGGLIGGLLYIGAGVAAVLASAGTLAAIITAGAIGGGAGALIGSVLAKLVGDHHAHYLQEQLDHGGLLLWVATTDEEHEKRATQILKKHSGCDAEERHVEALLRVFERLGEAPPADDWQKRVAAPDSLARACVDAVEAEIQNDAMYARLLQRVSDP